jgi:transaldolase
LKRVVERDGLRIDPGHLAWSGIAVMKECVRVFRARGLTARPLAAAYRHALHWTELIGPGIVQTIPYTWWKQFDVSTTTPRATLSLPVDDAILSSLRTIPDFVRAHDAGALPSSEFATYGATVHTLTQFLDGYDGLVKLVRERMLP